MLGEFLDAVATGKGPLILVFAFELKLLNELGLTPDVATMRLSPGAREIAKKLLDTDFSLGSRIHLSPPQANELRQFLHGFLIFHLGKIPSSRTAALA